MMVKFILYRPLTLQVALAMAQANTILPPVMIVLSKLGITMLGMATLTLPILALIVPALGKLALGR